MRVRWCAFQYLSMARSEEPAEPRLHLRVESDIWSVPSNRFANHRAAGGPGETVLQCS